MSAAKDMTPAAPLLLRQDSAEGVTILTLNRPAARNSLSLQLLETLQAALAAIGGDASVRCVVLAAHGPVFSAGHDLKEITAHRADPDGGRGFYDRAMETCAQVMLAITALPQPVIAAVQGVATAAGCQLVATCDLAVASDHARFATPGVDIGLFCSTPAVPLARAVPRKAAMEMLLLGEMIPAGEALRSGETIKQWLSAGPLPLGHLADPTTALGGATAKITAGTKVTVTAPRRDKAAGVKMETVTRTFEPAKTATPAKSSAPSTASGRASSAPRAAGSTITRLQPHRARSRPSSRRCTRPRADDRPRRATAARPRPGPRRHRASRRPSRRPRSPPHRCRPED